jgi:transcriptional regulator with GAF, ATPase, and Fis domain
MTMSYSVSAIRPDREYAPVRSFEDSAGINQGELIGSNASFRAVLKRVKIVAPTDSLVLAHKGTLFLDEIGDLPLQLRPKLLCALQEQEFERLGNSLTKRNDGMQPSSTEFVVVWPAQMTR